MTDQENTVNMAVCVNSKAEVAVPVSVFVLTVINIA